MGHVSLERLSERREPTVRLDFTTPNTLTFTTAPGNLVPITASFSYAFNCRFLDDQEDFENIMNGLWQLQSLKFRSVKP